MNKMPTNTDTNGESSLAAAVELTAEPTENMLQDLQRHYSLHLDKIERQSTSLCKKNKKTKNKRACTLAKLKL